ncbi:MAG TPA: HAMP domain-containing sensor histidine kinase [Patescibacteria group bacterium]|nr:HAMP domain-containing sensor histidine kinase [Patescibacteria group bacterium]
MKKRRTVHLPTLSALRSLRDFKNLRAKPTRWQLKVLLSLLAFGIVSAMLLYTQILVDELIEREKQSVEFYADVYRSYVTQPASDENLLFFMEKFNSTISFPIILTDKNDVPNFPYRDFSFNVHIDSTLSEEAQSRYMQNLVNEMGATYPPIIIRESEKGDVLFKIYYTNSALITRLQLLPYFEIIIVGAFILVGYIAFSYIRRSEQSNIWVGMAKEAAHQLGTPLSSLLAWTEILKMSAEEPDAVHATIAEMEQDIDRLNVIANRFSKIGSQPKKQIVNLTLLVEDVCQYLEKRLPNVGKKILLKRQLDEEISANVSVELFKWVIENLLKNAAESIETKEGSVTIALRKQSNGKIVITVTDTGKGMTPQVRRQVFLPGFTTKMRGWGLGLSLSRRIIEEYHKGRIYVRDSAPGKGTTFAIELEQVRLEAV